ncbi:MAG: hypothetical protein WBP58_09595 [Chitinophagaceae bacterium]
MLRISFTICMVLVTCIAFGQAAARTYLTKRTLQKPKIDGRPTEKVWTFEVSGISAHSV